MSFSTSDLPRRIDFNDLAGHLNQPYAFIVGQSRERLVVETLEQHTHILVCGTTGGGKSNFLNAMILALLQSSEALKLYLIDLKGGIEFECFSGVPGFDVVSSPSQASELLTTVQEEMELRFREMRALKIRKFDQQKMAKPRIVVVIDEASILFSLRSSDKTKRSQAQSARAVTEHLAKTARASGIHLVFATQRPDKASIDTSIRTNIGAVLSFRVPDITSSTLAVGNRSALDLPQIEGRGIWKHGNQIMEVQTPFLSSSDLDSALESLKIGSSKVSNKQPDGSGPACKFKAKLTAASSAFD